jgi:hypothetical protein
VPLSNEGPHPVRRYRRSASQRRNLSAPDRRTDSRRTGAALRADSTTRRRRGWQGQAAHQKTLAQAYDTLLYPLVIRQYRNLSARHPRDGSLEEHQAILLAIVTRNPAAAVAAMHHHVASARQALLLGRD